MTLREALLLFIENLAPREASDLYVSSFSSLDLQAIADIPVQLLTDLVVHDWWALVLGFARDNEENENETDSPVRWVGELMAEQEVKALPRSMETLGRCYDSREFWATFELMPTRTSIVG